MAYLFPSPDEWQRLEAPLLTIDPVLECFARNYDIALYKTGEESPQRSLHWGTNPNFLIQLYLERESEPSWSLWRCCFQQREGGLFWRNDFAVRGEKLELFQGDLPELLDESLVKLQAWAGDPAGFEWARSLAPFPDISDPL
jgi:hypothetical protein